MKRVLSLCLLLLAASLAIAQDSKKNRITVPVSIVVAADQNSASQIDLSVYTGQILAELNKSQNVEFILVDTDSNPDVMIDVKVSNLKIGQPIQRSSNKTVPTVRVTGTGANGRQTSLPGVLIREEVFVERNSSANFSTTLKITENPPYFTEKKFNSVYNYSRTTVDTPGNRNGSTNTILKQKPLPEPKTEEFLLLLSKKDLTGYLAGELRKVYSSKSQIAKVN